MTKYSGTYGDGLNQKGIEQRNITIKRLKNITFSSICVLPPASIDSTEVRQHDARENHTKIDIPT
jgi:hypothetical protein